MFSYFDNIHTGMDQRKQITLIHTLTVYGLLFSCLFFYRLLYSQTGPA